MEEVNLIAESIKFMFLGMGVVFSFLTIMIIVLKIQGSILTKYFPAEEKKAVNVTPMSNSTKIDAAKTAAIIAAVQHHKNLKG